MLLIQIQLNTFYEICFAILILDAYIHKLTGFPRMFDFMDFLLHVLDCIPTSGKQIANVVITICSRYT